MMKITAILKSIIDVAMLLLLLALTAYSLTGQELHELMGTVMGVLFILHNILNYKWYIVLFKGRYTAVRTVRTIINILLCIDVAGLIVSGIMMSGFVFPFLYAGGGMRFVRTLHMLCSYWGMILMSLHIGLHWSGMVSKAGKRIKIPPGTGVYIARICVAACSAYGIYSFVHNEIYKYLFLASEFVFFDMDKTILAHTAEYSAVIILFSAMSYYGAKLLKNR